MNVITNWFRRHLSDPQVVVLGALLVVGSMVVIFFGHMLAPLIAGVVIAYLLQGIINRLKKWRIPHLAAILLVFAVFMAFVFFLLIGLLPLLWEQLRQLFQQLPEMISWGQEQLLRLPDRYPDLISEDRITAVTDVLNAELTKKAQQILSLSVASVRAVIWVLVYIFLVPLLVFFFLKDKDRLLHWLSGFLPKDRSLATQVWKEVDQQIGNYIRGKFWEILIVWTVSYVTFAFLGLQFSMLISFFVGLSVLIPYIGATVMTLPVALIAYFQWGMGSDFAYVVCAYLVIQLLDGNVLVTILFSEVVNIHPVAIIAAILVFGGMFGFWGVFFAIPLATLVQAIIKAWFARNATDSSDGEKVIGAQGRGEPV
jgi:putative permease